MSWYCILFFKQKTAYEWRISYWSSDVCSSDLALQSLEGRDVVFVRTNQGFRAQKVTIGRRSAGRVEVLSGLKPGQMIATQNAFLLKAELGKGAGEEE